MNPEFGLKELTDLTLKVTYPIEMDGRVFEPGEVIARFDKIQIANFREVVSRISANGGFANEARVVWEDPKEIQLNFTQGIFSKKQFALMINAHLVKIQDNNCILIPSHFSGESDDNGNITLGKQYVQDVFIYNAKTSEKIKPKNIDLEKGEIVIDQPYCNVEIDFNYCYNNGASVALVGKKLIGGFLLLEGKTRVKDDITGKTRTALLRIPRLKLVSDLSMRLGRDAGPVLANFSAAGYPVGEKGNKRVMELLFLNDDIDAEI